MDYERLCDFYERLEATTKRLEMTDILVELLRESDEDLRSVVYLTRGQIAPDFEGVELGIAEKLVLRALVFVSGRSEADITKSYHTTGDLGDAAADALTARKATRRQSTLFTTEDDADGGKLVVGDVFARFQEIAAASGAGSQERKLNILQQLLLKAGPRSARYIVRTVTGKLRLGIADMTLLDALAAAYSAKEERPRLERAYNVSSDLGLVATTLQHEGLDGLDKLRMTVGVPIRAMLAERLPTPQEILAKLGGVGLCELKYDGLRLQAHIPKTGPVRFFSRRLEDLTAQFPDVAESLRAAFLGREAIVEGEAVAVEPDTGEMRPFQAIATRRGRKTDIERVIEEVPVCIFLFDCLYVDGDDVAARPLPERREALVCAFGSTPGRVEFSRAEIVDTEEKLLKFFDHSVAEGAEGIMVKSVQPDSVYRAGARGWQWIKYKRDYSSELNDSLDLVIVGALVGRGRRAGWVGALLMAAYDPERDVFETVCKLGTGFDDATLIALTEELKEHTHEGPHPRVRSKLEADLWFEPYKVAEVVGAELTLSPIHTAAENMLREGAGLAVRFPRFTGRWRDDKKAEQATAIEELVAMYRAQGHRAVEGDE